jgi:surface antigen
MTLKTLLYAVVVVLLVSGCGSYGTKQTIGGLGGAAAGGLAGAQFGSGTGQLAATAIGALLGAVLGSEVGANLDDVDRLRAQQAYDRARAAPVGDTITWNNPDTGHSGTVTPVRDGRSESGDYCREFQQSVTVSGRTEDAYGVACRMADGSWQIVDEAS